MAVVLRLGLQLRILKRVRRQSVYLGFGALELVFEQQLASQCLPVFRRRCIVAIPPDILNLLFCFFQLLLRLAKLRMVFPVVRTRRRKLLAGRGQTSERIIQ